MRGVDVDHECTKELAMTYGQQIQRLFATAKETRMLGLQILFFSLALRMVLVIEEDFESRSSRQVAVRTSLRAS